MLVQLNLQQNLLALFSSNLINCWVTHLPWMLLQACQKLHWQLQWQLPGMNYAPVPAAAEGAVSTLPMLVAASPHLSPWDALVPGGALGTPSWKVPGKVWVMGADLPEKLGDLEQQLISHHTASRLHRNAMLVITMPSTTVPKSQIAV